MTEEREKISALDAEGDLLSALDATRDD